MAASTQSLATALTSTFQAFSDPSFRKLWIASTFWYVARAMEMIVLAWLVLDLTNSPAQVAYVGFFRMLPMLLLGMVTGGIADRFSKKSVLIVSQGVCIAGAGGLLLLLILGTVAPWHGYLAIFMTGIANALDFAARRAYYSEILPPERLVNAISLDMASMMGSSIIGPAVGGVLIAVAGFAGAYAAMVAMYGACLVLTAHVRRRAPARRSSLGSPLAQVGATIGIVRTNRVIMTALLVTIVFNLASGPFMTLISVVARDTLGANDVLFGALAASPGVGALLGSLFMASRGVRRPATVYTFGAAAFLLGIMLFSVSRVYALSLGLLVLAGLGQSGFGTMQTMIALRAVGPELRGRVLGAIGVGIGASPLGILVAGYLAERIGTPQTLAAMSGAGVVLLVGLWLVFPELRDKKPSTPSPSPLVAT